MKKWAQRIGLALSVLAAPAVAQFVCTSVQGGRPSHDRVEAQEQHRSSTFLSCRASSCPSARST